MKLTSTRLWALCILIAAGCHGSGKRQPNPPPPPVVGRGTPAVPPKPLAIPDRPLSPARLPDPLDDKQSMIPKPPSASDMALPPRKEPATGLELAKAGPTADNVQTIGATETAIPDARAGDTALESMRQQHLNAVTAWSKIDAFDARLTRRESINGKTTPQEVIHFMFRKEPYSVRLKWIGTEGQGREVVYVQGQYGGKMHIQPTRQDSAPLPPLRMAFAPDSRMVRGKSRHDIREAGLNDAIRQIGSTLDIITRQPNQRQRLRHLGMVTRPEYVTRMNAIEETIPPGAEELLPQGGKRVIFFDTAPDSPSVHLPVLVITHDHAGQEVEYYCFDRMTTKLRLTDADFDPEVVFKKK